MRSQDHGIRWVDFNSVELGEEKGIVLQYFGGEEGWGLPLAHYLLPNIAVAGLGVALVVGHWTNQNHS